MFVGWQFGDYLQAKPNAALRDFIQLLGDLFLNALKMLILPLIVAAVVSSVAGLGDVRKLGRLGGVTLLYYFITTVVAVTIGLILVNLIQPGVGMQITVGNPDAASRIEAGKEVGYASILLKMISPNLVGSAAELQLLPIILFSVAFGAALSQVQGGKGLIADFKAANEAMMKLVNWVMYFAPVGISALVISRLSKAGGGVAFEAELDRVSLHVFTVLSGLGIHFIALTVALFFLTGRGWPYLKTLARALFTAFGTASSSATVPMTLDCAREAGVSERSAQFAIPLGSTVNMNGTALYEAAAAMFIAQAAGFELNLGQQIVVLVTATLAAIGAAGIPEAGIVTIVIVLDAVGLPLDGIELLLAVDWFLDRFRTTVNVWGDAVGAAVADKLAPEQQPPPSGENLTATAL